MANVFTGIYNLLPMMDSLWHKANQPVLVSASPLVGQLLVDFTNIQFQVKDLLALDI